MNIKSVIAKLLVLVLIISTVSIGSPMPVHAWKVSTHVYSANIIIDELRANNGWLEIPPFGKFKVRQEYADSILNYPDYYRAGAMGPDVLPDIYVGQMVLHPGTGQKSSGRLIDDICKYARGLPIAALPQNLTTSPYSNASLHGKLDLTNRLQATAFVLGLTTHEAGDLFGHSYINKWSGGAWPAVTEMAQDPEKLKIVLRHNILEAYIDKKIPEAYKDAGHNAIAVPKQLVMDTLMGNGQGMYTDSFKMDYNDLSGLFPKSETHPIHLKAFYDMRNALRKEAIASEAYIERHKNDEGLESLDPTIKAQILYNKAKAAYIKAWIADIDEGLEAWVTTGETVARYLLEPGGMEKVVPEYEKWAEEHALKMLGSPDVAAEIIQLLGGVEEFFVDILPKAIQDAVKPLKIKLINKMLGWIYPSNSEENQVTYEKLKDIAKNPELYLKNSGLFPANAQAQTGSPSDSPETQILNDMGNFSNTSIASEQTFAPFYNTLVMAKLNILSFEGIQNLRLAAKSTEIHMSNNTDETIMADFPNMDVGYDWDNPDFSWFVLGSGEDKIKIFDKIFQVSQSASVREATLFNLRFGYWASSVDGGMVGGSDASIDYTLKSPKTGAKIGLYSVSKMYQPESAIASQDIQPGSVGGTFSHPVPTDKPGNYIFCIYEGTNLLGTSDKFYVSPDGDLVGPDGTVLKNGDPISFRNFRFGHWGKKQDGTYDWDESGKAIGGSDLTVDYIIRSDLNGFTVGLYKENAVSSPSQAIYSDNPKAKQGSFYTKIPVDQPGKYVLCAFEGQTRVFSGYTMEVIAGGDIIMPSGGVHRDVRPVKPTGLTDDGANNQGNIPGGNQAPNIPGAKIDTGKLPGTTLGTDPETATEPTPGTNTGTNPGTTPGNTSNTPGTPSVPESSSDPVLSQQNDGTWTGIWETSYGTMVLTQAGNKVTGVYANTNYKIEGTINAGKLEGTFDEGGNNGKFEYVMDSDGKSFSGKWKYFSGTEWNSWDGKRRSYVGTPTGTAAEPSLGVSPWKGVWFSDYGTIIFAQDGSKLYGTYGENEYKLTGEVSGNEAKGTFINEEGKNCEFKFIMFPDGQIFTGTWLYKGSSQWQNWNGTRVN